MSIKFNNVIPFPKQKVDNTLTEIGEKILQKQKEIDELDAVSYTHLTLPTILLV